VGKITLPSTILQFWDLGGQRGIRNIWPKYYDDCHAVVYVIDADDRERLGEGWEVFGMFIPTAQDLTWLTLRMRYRLSSLCSTNTGRPIASPRQQTRLCNEPFR
jgi:GTPase SAR1 family protein